MNRFMRSGESPQSARTMSVAKHIIVRIASSVPDAVSACPAVPGRSAVGKSAFTCLVRKIAYHCGSIGRPHRLVRSRTPPFHGGNRGSNPLGVALPRCVCGVARKLASETKRRSACKAPRGCGMNSMRVGATHRAATRCPRSCAQSKRCRQSSASARTCWRLREKRSVTC